MISFWCYASNQRVHCLFCLPNETTSSATEPACSSDRATSLTLGLNKQHVDTRYSYHIPKLHTIFTHDIRISVFKTQGLHHGKQRHQPFEIKFAQIFVGLQLKIFKPREFYSIETFSRRDYQFTRTHTDVNSHVCVGYSGRCLFYFQCSTVKICTKGNVC